LSWAFRRFLESLNTAQDDRRHAEEFDLAALGALTGEGRARAEGLLLERLRRRPRDLRVFSALELVGSSRSVEPLRNAIDEEPGLRRVRAAAALAQIDDGFDPTPVLLAALRGSDASARPEAARGLAGSPAEVAVPALLDSLGDPYFGMRIAVFDALLERLDLKRYRVHELGRVKKIGTRLLSGLRSVWEGAADEVREVVAALQRGRTPEEIGLGEAVTSTREELDSVVASLRGRDSDGRWRDRLDLDSLARLDEVGRRYVETLLLSDLEHGDERLPAALAVLSGEAALAAMREALPDAQGGLRLELARALDRVGDQSDRARARKILEESARP
jgi:hypothetical protein